MSLWLSERRQIFNEMVASARLQMQERHHSENMEIQQAKMLAENRQISEMNNTRLALSRQENFYKQLDRGSDLIDSQLNSHLDRKRDWKNTLAETKKSLLEIEADTLRQSILSKQEHEQTLEKMRLEAELKHQEKDQVFSHQVFSENQRAENEKQAEKLKHSQEIEKLVFDYNLKFMEKHLDSHLQDHRVTYDGLNDIVMLLIKRLLGLGEQQINDEDLESYVQEAMAQAYGEP